MINTRHEVSVLFDGSFEGFLCVLYAYYYERILPVRIQAGESYQQTLELDEYYVPTNYERSDRVRKGISKKISQAAEYYLFNACLSAEHDRFTDMFKYALMGFKVGAAVDDHMQLDFVLHVHKMARYVGREAHLLSGFCRFAETKSGVYYCDISPVNNVLPILAAHFSDRLMNQGWVIHDIKRGQAAVYDGNEYIITEVPSAVRVDYAENEEQIQDLWVAFFNTLAIKERANKKLQRNNLPLHFRKSMLEFGRKL